jgi:hypothetical protein
MSDAPIDLAFIGHALNRMTSEVMTLRDDVGVLTAICMRLDGSHSALLNELRAMHTQHSRLAGRVAALEKL